MSDGEVVSMPTEDVSTSTLGDGDYVEEEVEVSDDDNPADEEVAKIPAQPPLANVKKTAPQALPGRVKPSRDVENAPMENPETLRLKSKNTLPRDKNPFPTHGTWNAHSLSQIEIRFPALTGNNETTNELTRSTRPEARYWKALISFGFNNFVSDTMRFDNVHIPFHTGKGYGENYVYMVLPPDAADAFAAAGKKVAPTKVTENSLMEDKARWWKIANKVEGLFGTINATTRKFQSKSIATIFDSTQSGMTCNVTLRFYCKASTSEKEPLRPTTPRHVSVEVVRGYISAVDVNVQLPTKVSRQKVRAEPTAVSRDIANDDLMKRLQSLGL